MKAFLSEIWDPVKDFYKMHTKKEIIISVTITIFFGVISYFIGDNLHPRYEFCLADFCVDVINQILTILTLFISFSMAYLSILITSSSKNVDDLKNTYSEKYFLGKKSCSLYQVLASEITYTLFFEIFFLALVLIERFLICLCSEIMLQIVLSINIGCFVHVMLMMLLIIKDMYYSFWRSK